MSPNILTLLHQNHNLSHFLFFTNHSLKKKFCFFLLFYFSSSSLGWSRKLSCLVTCYVFVQSCYSFKKIKKIKMPEYGREHLTADWGQTGHDMKNLILYKVYRQVLLFPKWYINPKLTNKRLRYGLFSKINVWRPIAAKPAMIWKIIFYTKLTGWFCHF